MDVALLYGQLDHRAVIAERVQMDVGGSEVLFGCRKLVGEDGHHSQDVTSVLPQGFDGAEAASSGRNEVLDNNDLSVLPAFALYLIVQPVGFR